MLHENEKITVTYQVSSSNPRLVIGVTDQAGMLLGTWTGPAGQEAAWLTRVTDPGELMQLIEQARVNQAQAARELYPLPRQIRDVLAAAPAGGILFPEIMWELGHGTWRGPEGWEVTSELRNMEREGTVHRLGAAGRGTRWALVKR